MIKNKDECDPPKTGLIYFEDDTDKKSTENILKTIACRLNMDLKNKVNNLEKHGLLDPGNFEKSIIRVEEESHKTSWATTVYPHYYDSEGKKMAPKCIYVPDRKVFRIMIKAIIEKHVDTSDFRFLLKFGLLENLSEYQK